VAPFLQRAHLAPAPFDIIVGGGTIAITDVDVRIDATHTWDGDLDISLTSPTGTNVLLSDNHGGSGDNYQVTVFNDEAATPIASGSPPFDGEFIPDNPLVAFDGENANGTWTLTIDDVFVPADSGTLNSWDLILSGPVLDSLAGSNYTALTAVGIQRSQSYLTMLSDRLAVFAPYNATSPFGSNPLAQSRTRANDIQLVSFESMNTAESSLASDSGSCDCYPSAWSGWVTGYGLNANVNPAAGAEGIDYNYAGTAFGVERWVGERTRWGVAGGYANTYVGTDVLNQRTDADTFQVALYGNHVAANNRYLTGIAMYAHHDNDSRRITGADVASGSYNGDEFAAYVETGMITDVRFWTSRPMAGCTERTMTLQPLLALQYILLNESAFSEQGTGALLNIPSRTEDSLRASVGLRLSKSYVNRHGWLVTPQLRGRYPQELLNGSGIINAQIAGGNGAFTVPGNDLGGEFGQLGHGVTAQISDRLAVRGGYDYSFGHRLDAHAGYVGLTFIR